MYAYKSTENVSINEFLTNKLKTFPDNQARITQSHNTESK